MSRWTRIILLSFFYFISCRANSQALYEKHSPAINRLATALSFRTFIPVTGSVSYEPYQDFLDWLTQSFPLIRQRLTRTIINDYSIIYKWQGSSNQGSPVLLTAHYDVATMARDNEPLWSHPPFHGFIDREFIWGRGALDNKSQVLGMMEAVEQLLKDNFKPQNDVYLAFGHDEETGGLQGAAKMSEFFSQQQLRFSFVLDEGGAIVENVIPGLSKMMAFIGTAEKGYANVELSVDGPGGHPSVPMSENTINLLASAINSLEKHPMPAKLQSPTTEMLKAMAPHMQFPSKLAVKHPRLFSKKIIRELDKNPATAALVRSIFIPTMITGGNKENVLPGLATANINVRLLQEDDSTTVMNYINRTINDSRVKAIIKPPYKAPSVVSSSTGEMWKLMEAAINKQFPGVTVSPGLFPGSTDSYHYMQQVGDVYRFTPVIISAENAKTIHGIDERISIDGYRKAIGFYVDLLKRL